MLPSPSCTIAQPSESCVVWSNFFFFFGTKEPLSLNRTRPATPPALRSLWSPDWEERKDWGHGFWDGERIIGQDHRHAFGDSGAFITLIAADSKSIYPPPPPPPTPPSSDTQTCRSPAGWKQTPHRHIIPPPSSRHPPTKGLSSDVTTHTQPPIPLPNPPTQTHRTQISVFVICICTHTRVHGEDFLSQHALLFFPEVFGGKVKDYRFSGTSSRCTLNACLIP